MPGPVSKPAPPPQIGAQIAASSSRSASPLIADKSASSGTGTKPTKKAASGTGTKSPESGPSGTGTKGVSGPKKKRTDRPMRMDGYSWRDDGPGWQLRKSVMIDGKRTRPYIAHLSKSAYREMKRTYGKDLPDALRQWVAEKERGK